MTAKRSGICHPEGRRILYSNQQDPSQKRLRMTDSHFLGPARTGVVQMRNNYILVDGGYYMTGRHCILDSVQAMSIVLPIEMGLEE
jgi:hypothetical protein